MAVLRLLVILALASQCVMSGRDRDNAHEDATPRPSREGRRDERTGKDDRTGRDRERNSERRDGRDGGGDTLTPEPTIAQAPPTTPSPTMCIDPTTGYFASPEICHQDPCMYPTGCPKYPSAICVANTCGGCHERYEHYDEDVTDDCGCVNPMTGEGDDDKEDECPYDPCHTASCSGNPGAICVANYCGGCHALFVDSESGRDVTAQCSTPTPVTDPTSTASPTTGSPTTGAPTTGSPTTNTPTTSSPTTASPTTPAPISPSPTTPSPSEDGMIGAVECVHPVTGLDDVIYECVEDPCEYPAIGCPKYPSAACTPNYCGGCHETYKPECGCRNPMTGKGDDLVDEDDCADPCDGATCIAYPYATCTADYCGGCFALWTDDAGESVDCMEGVEECMNPMTGLRDVMKGADDCDDPCEYPAVGCPKFPTAACVANYCGGCHETYKPECGCRNPMTGKGDDEVECDEDPCEYTICAADHSAVCSSSKCGGCFAIFTDAGGNVVDCEADSAHAFAGVAQSDADGTLLLSEVLDWFLTEYPTATALVSLCGLLAIFATAMLFLRAAVRYAQPHTDKRAVISYEEVRLNNSDASSTAASASESETEV